MLELIKAKSGEKNCPAKKNRKREESDDFIKEINPRQTPKRSKRASKKRQSQPILNSLRLSGGKDFLFSFYHERERTYPSGKGGCGSIMNWQG
jgi:hypothetical protein